MSDLTTQAVRQLCAAIGIDLTDADDLLDVTLRLNATLEHLSALDQFAVDDEAFLNVKDL